MIPRRAFFTPALFSFLKSLKRNNNRAWFLKNKEKYERLVRNPLLDFIGQLGPGMRKISPHLWVDNSPQGGSMFRLYRDTRFSKDKTPYKTHVAAWFPLSRQKDVHTPGFYIHLAPGEVFAGGGVWHPDAPTLAQIRDYLLNHPGEWKGILSGPAFKRHCTLDGEKLKRPPKGYPPDHPMIETLKYKDYIYYSSFTEKQACAPDFMDRFLASCEAGSPLVGYLARALKIAW
ncbi:MAG TPA: DUF2461 domain-containing protein [bacterium]|nr:DUF2461 domain-containing protein [bacterium]